MARLLVSELYAAATRGQRRSALPRVATFYEEWNRIFGVVYGEKLEKAESAAQETARLYGMPANIRLKTLLFAIHTFYAFLMKLMAIELLALQKGFNVGSFVEGLASQDDDKVRGRLSHMESGAGFVEMGITNFLEADFFSWYLDAWNPRIAGAARDIIRALADFEPATPILEPEWTRDLLQKLYELVVPRILRHGLGEYYTPDWLAEYLVAKTGYDGKPGVRFLDPACGSGTFLVQAIHRASQHATGRSHKQLAEVGRSIFNDIVGFDLNPLAVLAARTNYLIAVSRFLPFVRPVSIPVYLCDSVLPPDLEQPLRPQGELFGQDTVVFRTKEHDYVFPVSMKNKERIDRFTGLVMMGLRAKMDLAQFQRLLVKQLPLPPPEQARLETIYSTIKQLDDEKRDGIWAHYIKNAFAPVYVEQFDFVIGNPPWIRWGYMAEEYRQRTLKLWQDYGLFSLKGHATRLGAGEKDFSMLFTYTCADRYLKEGGTLGFVITQEVFKAKGAGEGFRRFQLGEQGAYLAITGMEDMVHLQPFQAANKTTIFTLQKGRRTHYPVPVVEWKRKAGVGKIPPEWPLTAVLEKTERTPLKAIPMDLKKSVSSWQTASKTDLRLSLMLKGPCPYLARLGARVEPYGIFWLNLKEVRPDGILVVENQHDRGKREVNKVTSALEPDLVFPAVSGGDIVKFGI
ncbi:MAG: N-6 DNA methylase, partial [Verrucomicrobiota bacterium]